MNTINELVIFGNISTALEISEIVTEHNNGFFNKIQMLYFDDNFLKNGELLDKVNNSSYNIYYIISFNIYDIKLKCLSSIEGFTNFIPYTVINPSAYISPSAKIGSGCYIAANSSISTNAVIQDHCQVNLNASVGHDSFIEKHCAILPGARVSGNVKIGEGTLVGANAFIYQDITVGKHNLIDALTYIHDNLPDKMISSSRNTRTFKRVM